MRSSSSGAFLRNKGVNVVVPFTAGQVSTDLFASSIRVTLFDNGVIIQVLHYPYRNGRHREGRETQREAPFPQELSPARRLLALWPLRNVQEERELFKEEPQYGEESQEEGVLQDQASGRG